MGSPSCVVGPEFGMLPRTLVSDANDSPKRSTPRRQATSSWSLRSRLGFTLLLVVIGLALRWQALDVPYFSDDYMQLGMLAGTYPGEHPAWDLYDFIRADPELFALHKEVGTLPWWAFEELNGSVLRPLSSLTIWLDWQLWPANSRASHLHNFVWWIAMIFAASTFLFRVLPLRVAALALTILTFDHGISMSLGWVANRASLICATFSFLALDAHVRSRETGKRGVSWTTLILLTLALLAGEYALVGFAYLFSLECFTRDEPYIPRLARLWPCAIPLVLYIGWHVVGGYGTYGEAVYANPLRTPVAYLQWFVSRFPRAIAELLISFPAAPRDMLDRPLFAWVNLPELDGLGWIPGEDWKNSLTTFLRVQTGVAIALVLLLSPLLLRALKSEETHTAIATPRPVAALACGAALGLVPILVAPAESRTLPLCQLGAAPLIATFILQVFDSRWAREPWSIAGLLRAALALWMSGLHLVADPAYSVRILRSLEFTHQPTVDSLRRLADEADLAGRDVVVLNTASHTAALHGGIVVGLMGATPPRSWHVVSLSSSALTIQRMDARSLIVIPTGASLLGSPAERFYRPERIGLEKGQRFSSGPFEVEVLSKGKAPDGSERRLDVKTLRLVFDEELERGDYLFLTTNRQNGRLEPVTIPAAPGMVRINAPISPD